MTARELENSGERGDEHMRLRPRESTRNWRDRTRNRINEIASFLGVVLSGKRMVPVLARRERAMCRFQDPLMDNRTGPHRRSKEQSEHFRVRVRFRQDP